MLRRYNFLASSIFALLVILAYPHKLQAYNMGQWDPLPYGAHLLYTVGGYYPEPSPTMRYSQDVRQTIDISAPGSCAWPDERKLVYNEINGTLGHYLDDYLQKFVDGTRNETRWYDYLLSVQNAWFESYSSWLAHGGGTINSQPFTWYAAEMQPGLFWTGHGFHAWDGSSWSPPVGNDDIFWAGASNLCGDSYTGEGGSWKFTIAQADPQMYEIILFDMQTYWAVRMWERQQYWNGSSWVTLSQTSRYYNADLGLIMLIDETELKYDPYWKQYYYPAWLYGELNP